MSADAPNRTLPLVPYPAKVITFANTPFLHVLANFIVHMHRALGPSDAPAFEVHAMDDAAFLVCSRMLGTGLTSSGCVRADCCNWSHGMPLRLTGTPIEAEALLTEDDRRLGRVNGTGPRARLVHAPEACRRHGCTGLANDSALDDSFLGAYAAAQRINEGTAHAVLSQLRWQGRRAAAEELEARLVRHQQTEGIMMYKMIAAYRLLRRDPTTPVLVLDATSLVSSRACFDELLRYPEDIVVSAEPKRGCPVGPSFSLGAVANTGALLLRPAALGFVRGLIVNQRGRYRNKCYEQEAFNAELIDAGFRWDRFPLTGRFPARRGAEQRVGGYRGLSVRFLNYSHWPRGFDKKHRRSKADDIWFAESPRRACLFHPYIRDKKWHAATYARHGLWYL